MFCGSVLYFQADVETQIPSHLQTCLRLSVLAAAKIPSNLAAVKIVSAAVKIVSAAVNL